MLVSDPLGGRNPEMSLRRPKGKRTQHCTFCKNHGLNNPKKGHHCTFLNCSCPLCKLTRKAQMAMRHQQRVWRHQKQKLKSLRFEVEEQAPPGENKVIFVRRAPQMATNPITTTAQRLHNQRPLRAVTHLPNQDCGPNKSQACDKCRNHNILKLKRNHQCPYQDCPCEYCSLTFKRREIMKHQQRVRRSCVTSPAENETNNAPADDHDDSQQDFSSYNGRGDQGDGGGIGSECNEEPSQEGYSCHVGEASNQDEADQEDRDTCSVQVESLSPSPRMREEVQFVHQNHPFSYSERSNLQSELEERKTKDSPPPLIDMVSNSLSPAKLYSRDTRSASPPSYYEYLSPKYGSSRPDTYSDSSLRYDSSHDDSKEEEPYNSSVVLCQKRTTSTASRHFPFPASQPLQSLSALNASLEPSMPPIKFGVFEDFHLRSNGTWLPSTLIGTSFRGISQTASLLPPHPQHHMPQLQQPIRPLPLNMPHTTRHNGSFPQQIWNQMFFPFSFGLQHGSSSNLERFHGIVNASRITSRDLFHPA